MKFVQSMIVALEAFSIYFYDWMLENNLDKLTFLLFLLFNRNQTAINVVITGPTSAVSVTVILVG